MRSTMETSLSLSAQSDNILEVTVVSATTHTHFTPVGQASGSAT